MTRPLRVCWFGAWRQDYSRNRIMIEGLRRAGVEVVECHTPLWGGIEDRVRLAAGGWANPLFPFRLLRAWFRLLLRLRAAGRWDLLMLGYPGLFDTPLAWCVARLRRKKLVLDAFMSPWLIAWERGLVKKAPLTGRLLHAVEKAALRLPDRLIQDTAEYAAWLSREFGTAPGRVRLVPTGADSALFHPRPAPPDPAGVFRVLYVGTFIPNHGVLRMLAAAIRLRGHADIRFTFLGDGPDKPAAEAFVREHGLAQVAFEPFRPAAEIPDRLAAADLCLGAFGDTPQSLMTVQNKIYEALAMGKPLVTGDGPAVRAVLTHGEHLWLCPRDNPRALADAILTLKNDPGLRRALAEKGRARFLEIGSLEVIGATLRRHLEELAG